MGGVGWGLPPPLRLKTVIRTFGGRAGERGMSGEGDWVSYFQGDQKGVFGAIKAIFEDTWVFFLLSSNF